MVNRSLSLRAILILAFTAFVVFGCSPEVGSPDPDTKEDITDDLPPEVDTVPDEVDTDAPPCVPACGASVCGLDPVCGEEDCGQCGEGSVCVGGVCECVPNCFGAVCGDEDGCGGLCDGTCEPDFTCNDAFECEPVVCPADCTGAACGDDDGCGGLCDGTCEEGSFCNEEFECELNSCSFDCIDHPDCVGIFTAAQLGACLESKCVHDPLCGDWQCKMVPVANPLCCDSVEDCPLPNQCSTVACVQKNCAYTKIEDCCLVDPELLFELDFDDLEAGQSPPMVAMVVEDEDPLPLDNVSWTAQEDPCGDGMALYLGDPVCGTYFNGELLDCVPLNDTDCASSEDCPPPSTCDTSGVTPLNKCTGVDATAVAFEAVVPEVILPVDAFVVLFFSVRTDLEPLTGGIAFDTLRLFVEHTPDPDLPPVKVQVHLAPQSTAGGCTVFAVDLTTFVPVTSIPGEEVPDGVVDLIWRFDTFDGTDNHHPGIWLDDIRVESFCDNCSSAATCNDGNVCTSNSCVDLVFGGEADEGLCYNPQIFDNCVPCDVPGDCAADAPPGYLWECSELQGYCLYMPDPDLCVVPTEPVLFDGGLEEAELPEAWEVLVTAPPASDDVTWQVTNTKACDGSYALYFGNGEDYDCGQALCTAQVTTPEIDLSEVEELFDLRLSFCANLSTEWDDVEPGEYPANNASSPQIDVLYVEVLVDDVVTEVWNSDVLHGTTYGIWEDAWADLSPYRGETIRLRFRFTTGTAEPANNDNAGVFVDNIRVEKVCGMVCGSAADCVGGGACTAAVCDFGACSYPVDPECCTAEINPGCDDGNPCTNDSCQLGASTCVHTFNGVPQCCSPTLSVFADSFLSAQNTAWYVPQSIISCGVFPFECEDEEGEDCMTCPTDCGVCPVRWTVTNHQSFTAPFSLYFGNPGVWNYENGQNPVRGFIASPDVVMPPYGIPAVSFHLWLDTEHTVTWSFFEQKVEYDILRLHVQEKDEGAYGAMTEVWNSMAWDVKGSTYDPNEGAVIWKQIHAALDGMDLANATVRFVFEFDSFDDSNNDHLGVYVDDFKVSTFCDDAFECLSAYDCAETTPADPNCSIELCDGLGGVSGSCYAEANTALPGCCIQELVGEMGADFDAPCGMEGWEASPTPDQTPVAWQFWDEYNHTQGGECALYFGNPATGNYDNPGQTPQGIVTSPTWAIPAGLDAEVEVSFWLWMDLEDTWSLTDVLKLHMGLKLYPTLPPNEEIPLWSKPCLLTDGLCEPPVEGFEAHCENYCDEWGITNWPWGQWKHVTITVPTALFGQHDYLNFWFTFDAGDPVNNEGVGVFVDDFEVLTTCLP
ncbi:MAG: hypothetical protein ABIK09_01205 [Pseudomonadota bacterium]